MIATRHSAAPRLLCYAFVLCLVAFAMLPSQAVAAGETWTKGSKKVLIIPVRFSDLAGPSDTPGPGGYLSRWGKVADGTMTAEISEFFHHQSYGHLEMEFTVLPEIDLGVSYAVYNANYGSTGQSKYTHWDSPGSFADDVRSKARQVGMGTATPAMYDTDNYDLDVIACGFIPGQGVYASGKSFTKGVFATTYVALAHELCHNLGLQHANGASRATLFSPLKTGSFFFSTYGDGYDLMGQKFTDSASPLPPDRDVNAFWKYQLGWLTDDFISTPATSGMYRIHAFDQGSVEVGKSYALRVVRDSNFVYWFDYRQAIVGIDAQWAANGLEVHIGGESIPTTAGHTLLIDTTPGSRGPAATEFATMRDAPLAIGRTYTDPEANLHVTNLKKGGTVPESLDVMVTSVPSRAMWPRSLRLFRPRLT